MAIYHMSVKAVSRSAGRSATGAAAYRSGEKIMDERTGEIHDYTRKGGVEFSEIVMPAGATWEPTRAELWNAAELSEKRKDACVAREHEIALPKELSAEQRTYLVQEYAKDLADRHKCAVDIAIHAPHKDKGGEINDNYHAHLLCTTREVDGQGLGAKCLREQAGQKRGADLELERSTWADLQNSHLAKHGHAERVDHRSLEAQGIDREPTRHKGPAVTEMERRGIQTEVSQRLEAARLAGEFERSLVVALDNAIESKSISLAEALKERASSQAPKPESRYSPENMAKREAEQAEKAAKLAAIEKQIEGSNFTQAQRAIILDRARENIEKAPAQVQQAAEPEKPGPLTPADRELEKRIEAAIKADDPDKLEDCFNSIGGHRREAAQAAAALQPFDASPDKLARDLAGVERSIKNAQNREAKQRGEPEVWGIRGDPDGSAARQRMDKALGWANAHRDTSKPLIFGKAEWEATDAKLVREFEAQRDAVLRIEKELAQRIEQEKQRVAQEHAQGAARNTRNAPEREKAIERCKSLDELDKRLEVALKPHREREEDLDNGMGR